MRFKIMAFIKKERKKKEVVHYKERRAPKGVTKTG
jgi:hypothetical protein